MRKAAVVVLIVAGFALAAPRLSRAFDEWSAIRGATKRVEALLASMVAARGSLDGLEAQTAMCLWYKGAMVISDRDEMVEAQNGYIDWRRAQKLTRPIGSFEIVSARFVLPGELSPVLVLLRIDGEPRAFTVPRDRPIS